MLYKAKTGESSVLSPFKTALNNDDTVELIVTSIGLPFRYKASIEEKNKKAEEETILTGIEEELIVPTVKEGGLALEVAALYKISADGIETDFTDELSVEKGIYHTIVMPTPKEYLERGFDIKDQRRGGKIIEGSTDKPWIGIFSKENFPIIDDIYPSPKEECMWIDKQLIKVASLITDEDLDDLEHGKEYAKVLEKEKQRKLNWSTLLKLWENWTEVECRDFLLLSLSSRLLLHDKEPKKGSEYHLPKVGTRFTTKVKRGLDKEGKLSKYINFTSFEWNSTDRHWDYFSEGTFEAREEDIALAKEVSSKQVICFAS